MSWTRQRIREVLGQDLPITFTAPTWTRRSLTPGGPCWSGCVISDNDAQATEHVSLTGEVVRFCGACAEVCPVKIDIPRVLLELRKDIVESKTAAGTNKLERMAFRMWALAMTRPKAYERLAKVASMAAPSGDAKTGWIKDLPGFLAPGPVAGWLRERDLPRPAARSFRELWRERQK